MYHNTLGTKKLKDAIVFKILGHFQVLGGDPRGRTMSNMYLDMISRVGQNDHYRASRAHIKLLIVTKGYYVVKAFPCEQDIHITLMCFVGANHD